MSNFENYVPIFNEDEFNDKIVPNESTFIPSSPMVKTTATIISSFKQRINVDLLLVYLKHRHFNLSATSFFNQISVIIEIKIEGGVSRFINTKLFECGTIHLTGGRSIIEAKTAIKKLMKYMRTLEFKVQIEGEYDSDCEVPKTIKTYQDETMFDIEQLEFVYNMCNCGFEINAPYSFKGLYKIFYSLEMDAKYTPNTYAGLILKHVIDGHEITFIFFRSGKTTISLKSVVTKELRDHAYEFINTFIKERYDQLQTVTYKSNTPKTYLFNPLFKMRLAKD